MKSWNLKKLIVINLIVLNMAIIFLTVAFILLPTKTLAIAPENLPAIEPNNTTPPIELETPEKLSRRNRKYEYQVRATPGFITSEQDRVAIESALNNFGEDGWELSQTDAIFNSQTGAGLYIFIYKRER